MSPVRTRLWLPAAAYFGWVFAAGFVLGVLRVTFLAPAWGVRTAELVELPVMVALSWLAARWVTRRWPPASIVSALAVGGLALGLMLLLELTLVVQVQGLGLGQYLAGRDPVAFAAYLLSLLVFALWPAWFAWLNTRERPVSEKSARSDRPASRQ